MRVSVLCKSFYLSSLVPVTIYPVTLQICTRIWMWVCI